MIARASETAIEWTEVVWNPVVGCTKTSPGCKHRYAERIHQQRHRAYLAGKKMPAQYARPFTEVQLLPERLERPLRWKRPWLVFVNSMSDLFHPAVPFEFVARVIEVIRATPRHTYQVLTKRPERMRAFFQEADPPPNLWLGTSVEDQRWADERIPPLLGIPARVRFVSAEPLLGPLDLEAYLPGLDWLIVGGESGPEHRPIDPQWVRDLRDQAARHKVPFFFKQWGGRTAKSNGRLLDGRTHDAMPGVAR